MPREPRVFFQDSSTYVIGTDDIRAALKALGISAETHRWGATYFGQYVRRQGLWRATSTAPKDAKPGVCFTGRIRPNNQEI